MYTCRVCHNISIGQSPIYIDWEVYGTDLTNWSYVSFIRLKDGIGVPGQLISSVGVTIGGYHKKINSRHNHG